MLNHMEQFFFLFFLNIYQKQLEQTNRPLSQVRPQEITCNLALEDFKHFFFIIIITAITS